MKTYHIASHGPNRSWLAYCACFYSNHFRTWIKEEVKEQIRIFKIKPAVN